MVHEIFGNPIKGYGQEYYSAILEKISRRSRYPLYAEKSKNNRMVQIFKESKLYKKIYNHNGKNK